MTGKYNSDHIKWNEVLIPQYRSALALVCLGVWLHAADSLLVATMLPAIVAEIGGKNLIAWTIALYEIGSIVSGAASGLMAIRYGVRLPMSIAAGLFTIGCSISALAPTMWVMLGGRLLQGFGGGGLIALTFVAIGLLFPKRLNARVMAAVSTLWGLSAFLGPLVGGLFVELGAWRGGFWFFALQAFALAVWIVARTDQKSVIQKDATADQVPLLRLALLSSGVVLIAYGGIEIVPVRTAACILGGIGCLIVFLRLDAQATTSRLLPLKPLSLLTPTGAALAMILCFSIATIAITTYGPLLVTMLHGASALTAGFIVACSSIGWTISAIIVSGVAERHDPKFIAAGMFIVTASILGFTYSVPNGPVWLIATCAFMEGGGFGMAWTFILRRATTVASVEEMERISGAIPTIQRLGYALGAAYIGIVANAAGFASATESKPGFAASAIFAACLPFAAIGLIAMGRFVSYRGNAQ